MAPEKIKSYSRQRKKHLDGVDCPNILIAQNLLSEKIKVVTTNRKHKYQIKELPTRVTNVLSDESSLHVNIDDTFDKIAKGPIYQSVKYKDISYVRPKEEVNTAEDSQKNQKLHSFFNPYFNQYNTTCCHSGLPIEIHSANSTTEIQKAIDSWFNKPTLSTERIDNELEIEVIGSNKEKCFKNKSETSQSGLFRNSLIMHTPRSEIFKKQITLRNLSHKFDQPVGKNAENTALDFDKFLNYSGKFVSTPNCTPMTNKILKINNVNTKKQNEALFSITDNIVNKETSVFKGFDEDYINLCSTNSQNLLQISQAISDQTNSLSLLKNKSKTFNSNETRNSILKQSEDLKEGNAKELQFKDPISEDVNDDSSLDFVDNSLIETKPTDFLSIFGGKCWRRSLACKLNSPMKNDESHRARMRRKTIRIVLEGTINRKTILHKYAEAHLNKEDELLDQNDNPTVSLIPQISEPSIIAKDIILKQCNQEQLINFEELCTKTLLENCRKIGEGVYGEVFSYLQGASTFVMKIIPIEGELIVNGEKQKIFSEVLSEIIITLQLSNLQKNRINYTSGFVQVDKVCVVQGRYPKKLIDLWNIYHTVKGSENDSPEIFQDDQMYIVFNLMNAGEDLESFEFNNAMQVVSVVKQVACSLAVAEQQLQFEHRDLHWGNILLEKVDRNNNFHCKLNGSEIKDTTGGVKATIIDFTLSRIKHEGVVMFNDLAKDPDLFVAHGDYQFDIYRLMKNKNGNDWQKFEPYSNILWLHYVLDKSLTALRYKNIKTKIHKKGLKELDDLKQNILRYKSAVDFVSDSYY